MHLCVSVARRLLPMWKTRWLDFVESLDVLGGHDKATILRFATEGAKGNIEGRAYVDIPIGRYRRRDGIRSTPVIAIGVFIPRETWGLAGKPSGIRLALLIVDGQKIGHMVHFKAAPFYWVEFLRSDVEALAKGRSRVGRTQKADTERLTNWVWSLPLADRQPKHGRGTMLWRRYKPLCKNDTSAEPDLNDDYAIDVINKILDVSANVVAFPQPE
jgi:hypothetical protein